MSRIGEVRHEDHVRKTRTKGDNDGLVLGVGTARSGCPGCRRRGTRAGGTLGRVSAATGTMLRTLSKPVCRRTGRLVSM